MKKKITRLAVCALLFALCSSVQAQQPTKIPRIGFLTAVSVSSFAGRTEAFRQGLRELGYVEGKNIVIEYRYGDGKTDRMNQLADELVHIKVDIIVTGGAPATISAKDATRTFPL
jgi:putative ABC transport system substrate-binding protein